MSIEGQGHSFTIYFPGFVCFVLYLDKISGERLQDHWSSGYLIGQKVLEFFLKDKYFNKPGLVAQSVACPLRKQRSNDRSSHAAHSFMEK